jgi:hypothetical protein
MTIAFCESRMHVHEVDWSHTYVGLFQIDKRWFPNIGVKADKARFTSAAQQLRLAKYIQARQGWGAWPVCSKKAGL